MLRAQLPATLTEVHYVVDSIEPVDVEILLNNEVHLLVLQYETSKLTLLHLCLSCLPKNLSPSAYQYLCPNHFCRKLLPISAIRQLAWQDH